MMTAVDLANLREITGGDADVERALFQSFLESSLECITGLRASTPPERQDEWRKQAHAFKGSSLNLGAVKLGELCKLAQDQSHAPLDQKRVMLDAIEKEFSRVKEFLDETSSKLISR